jgi:PhnB protein
MPVKAIPDGYHSITPYLIVRDGAAALDFYARAFAAKERMRMPRPDGKVAHAEIEIGDSCLMLADEHPEMGAVGPAPDGGWSTGLNLYVEDCDAVFERAIAGGAKVVRPLADQFYGDRSGTIEDPFGHKWTISTHKEDLTPDQIAERMAAMCKP